MVSHAQHGESLATPDVCHEHGRIKPSALVRIGITLMAAPLVWFHVWEPLPHFSIIGIGGVLYGGWPIFEAAFENLGDRRMTMELSMMIALLAAVATGEFFTALIITAFVLAAEVLEGLAVGRARRAIDDLQQLLPRSAWIVTGEDAPREVAITEVSAGDRVLIRPGAGIPVDGYVISGSSSVEEAAITGESLPQHKLPGSRVFAGTLNQSGALEVSVETLGRDTTFGRIVQAVEEAEQTRAPIQKIADRLAGYLVYFALGSAALTLLLTHNLHSTISVIIVAGACGIAAGTPLAILGAIGRAARHGAIIKGGIYLEQLARIDTVLLDKTGTLTCGKPQVTAIIPAFGQSADDLLQIAAEAERNSEHPLGMAIVAAAQAKRLTMAASASFSYLPGKGVVAAVADHAVAVGNKVLMAEAGVALPAMNAPSGVRVFVARDGYFMGSIELADQIRDHAADAIRQLSQMGLKCELLTGDTSVVAAAVAESTGIHEISSGLLPLQKAARVDELIRLGRTVAMIGDGINDAPALARAHVGVAMGSGTEVAHASAHVLLIGNDLQKFAATVEIARWCRSIILQNFCGTLIVDALGIGLAAAGMISPLMAAFIHVTSEMAFILNSARLLPRRGPAGNSVVR